MTSSKRRTTTPADYRESKTASQDLPSSTVQTTTSPQPHHFPSSSSEARTEQRSQSSSIADMPQGKSPSSQSHKSSSANRTSLHQQNKPDHRMKQKPPQFPNELQEQQHFHVQPDNAQQQQLGTQTDKHVKQQKQQKHNSKEQQQQQQQQLQQIQTRQQNLQPSHQNISSPALVGSSSSSASATAAAATAAAAAAAAAYARSHSPHLQQFQQHQLQQQHKQPPQHQQHENQALPQLHQHHQESSAKQSNAFLQSQPQLQPHPFHSMPYQQGILAFAQQGSAFNQPPIPAQSIALPSSQVPLQQEHSKRQNTHHSRQQQQQQQAQQSPQQQQQQQQQQLNCLQQAIQHAQLFPQHTALAARPTAMSAGQASQHASASQTESNSTTHLHPALSLQHQQHASYLPQLHYMEGQFATHALVLHQQRRIAQLEADLASSRAEVAKLKADAEQERQNAPANGTQFTGSGNAPVGASTSSGVGVVGGAGASQDEQKKPGSRYWSPEEHQRFLHGLGLFGSKDIKAISRHVGTRSATQVRTHAQKYYLRLQREQSKKQTEVSNQDDTTGKQQTQNSSTEEHTDGGVHDDSRNGREQRASAYRNDIAIDNQDARSESTGSRNSGSENSVDVDVHHKDSDVREDNSSYRPREKFESRVEEADQQRTNSPGDTVELAITASVKTLDAGKECIADLEQNVPVSHVRSMHRYSAQLPIEQAKDKSSPRPASASDNTVNLEDKLHIPSASSIEGSPKDKPGNDLSANGVVHSARVFPLQQDNKEKPAPSHYSATSTSPSARRGFGYVSPPVSAAFPQVSRPAHDMPAKSERLGRQRPSPSALSMHGKQGTVESSLSREKLLSQRGDIQLTTTLKSGCSQIPDRPNVCAEPAQPVDGNIRTVDKYPPVSKEDMFSPFGNGPPTASNDGRKGLESDSRRSELLPSHHRASAHLGGQPAHTAKETPSSNERREIARTANEHNLESGTARSRKRPRTESANARARSDCGLGSSVVREHTPNTMHGSAAGQDSDAPRDENMSLSPSRSDLQANGMPDKQANKFGLTPVKSQKLSQASTSANADEIAPTCLPLTTHAGMAGPSGSRPPPSLRRNGSSTSVLADLSKGMLSRSNSFLMPSTRGVTRSNSILSLLSSLPTALRESSSTDRLLGFDIVGDERVLAALKSLDAGSNGSNSALNLMALNSSSSGLLGDRSLSFGQLHHITSLDDMDDPGTVALSLQDDSKWDAA